MIGGSLLIRGPCIDLLDPRRQRDVREGHEALIIHLLGPDHLSSDHKLDLGVQIEVGLGHYVELNPQYFFACVVVPTDLCVSSRLDDAKRGVRPALLVVPAPGGDSNGEQRERARQ